MAERERLPNRRAHDLRDFEHGGFLYTAGVGRDATGSVRELFLNVAKNGTVLDTTARDAAILASLALQHGASLDTIRHALTRNADGTASGAVGTLLDMIAAELAP